MDERWRNPDGTVNHGEYIASQEWRRRRRAFLAKHALCNRCGRDNDEHHRLFGTALHVHHVSYARLGAELDEDLETLCKDCHEDEESATFDPTEAGDYLAVQLRVGVKHGSLPIPSGDGTIDFHSPPEDYWNATLDRIDSRRRAIAGREETEEAWNELARLDWLERFTRTCLELPCPNDSVEIRSANAGTTRAALGPKDEE
jgi:HNH endonuclease